MSNSQKSANQFNFHPRYNLITGNNNSIGKSTLAKLLLWTIGCSPALDKTWKIQDVRSLLIFNIGNEEYSVARYDNQIFFKQPNHKWKEFEKITGLYSQLLSKILKFNVLLPNKKDNTKLENPPPSYYFLPFYIDQQKSWVSTWDGFSNLQQYSLWKPDVIKYHTGYINSEYFDILEKISNNKSDKKIADEQIKSIETSISVINNYLPNNPKIIALTNTELHELYQQVDYDLKKLQEEQENFFKIIAELNAEKVYYKSQLDLAIVASEELEKDYKFSVENIENDSISCPICGTKHDNSLVNRASILADKVEADNQIANLEKKLITIDNKLIKSKKNLNIIEIKINEINTKYDNFLSDNNDYLNSNHSVIEEIATSAIQVRVQKTIEEKVLEVGKIDKSIRELKKEQGKLLTKEDKEKLDSNFKLSLRSYIDQLDASAVNLSEISSALNYNKMHGNGGAAESTRGLLAYYYAVLKQIYNAENEVFAPIIIDTPNQQEQADFNYTKIIDFIIKHTPHTAQLIICAMDRSEIQSYKEQANTIVLDENKLLDTKKYNGLKHLLCFEDFEKTD
ncbi:hypothetical protein ACT44O_09405 [Acinetobacter baumannii]